MNLARIGNKEIGPKKKLFITFECGPTHTGFESAKKLIEKAAKSNADAIKFQIFRPQNLFSDKKYKINYKILNKKNRLINKSTSVYKLFEKRWLGYDGFSELKKIADKSKIFFFPTIGDEEGLEFVKKNNCKSIKIASSDLNYHQLILKASNLNINIQIDTGNSTLKEISEAIKIIKKRHSNIIIHYCPSGYPSSVKGANLKFIPLLKEKFNLPIAYSDHFLGENFNHIALALGVNLIEKTITENKYTKSIEHSMSLETKELNGFVENLRAADQMLNSKLYFLNSKEIKNRLLNRRSAYAAKNIIRGSRLSNKDIIFLRPGLGIAPNEINRYINKKLKKRINKGELIKNEYFN